MTRRWSPRRAPSEAERAMPKKEALRLIANAREDAVAALRDVVICDRPGCGATGATYYHACKGDGPTDECPGFQRMEQARRDAIRAAMEN